MYHFLLIHPVQYQRYWGISRSYVNKPWPCHETSVGEYKMIRIGKTDAVTFFDVSVKASVLRFMSPFVAEMRCNAIWKSMYVGLHVDMYFQWIGRLGDLETFHTQGKGFNRSIKVLYIEFYTGVLHCNLFQHKKTSILPSNTIRPIHCALLRSSDMM